LTYCCRDAAARALRGCDDGFVTVVSQGPRSHRGFFVFQARLEPKP
jgi:hypothetical protein